MGVNVYVEVPIVAVLTAGLQVPVIPLVEVVGNTGAGRSWHTGATGKNEGITDGAVTVTGKVAVAAHSPAVGVNVYIVVPTVAVLTAGLQVPLMPLVDVVGNTGAGRPWHTGATGLNVGIGDGVTVILNVAVVAHCPAVGVNV